MFRSALKGALTLVFAPWGGGGGALRKNNFGGDNQRAPAKILAPSSPENV